MTKSIRTTSSEAWNVTVARTPAEIEDLRPVWDQIQREQSVQVPDMNIDGYLCLIESMGDSGLPYVMLFCNNGQPKALVAGKIGRRQLRCNIGYKTLFTPSLRCITILYGGFLGEQTDDVCNQVVKALMHTLSQGEVDMLFFNNLRTDSTVYHKARKMPSFLCRSYFPKLETHWSMSIPESIDLFYQSLRSKSRNTLRRKIKKLEKKFQGKIKLVTYRSEENLSEGISAASGISRRTYQYALSAGLEDHEQTHGILKFFASRDWLRLSVLYVDGNPCSFQMGILYRNTYFLWRLGFDPEWTDWNVGTVLFVEVLEELCRESLATSFDFGFGDADYKRKYGDTYWHEASAYIFARRLRPIFINFLQTSVTGLSHCIEFILKKSGIWNWVRKRWRNVLQEAPKG